ncbi:MAG: hypothetical protein IRY99_21850 [Isosphaeraceae bacterium]|nr:hypothetical protein [Isosphaeraceae bacterium]
MTHFTVGIIVPNDRLSNLVGFVAAQMEPYCEHTEAEPYVCYSVGKAEAEIKHDIHRLERIIEREDPDYDLDKCRALLAKLRSTTPEERYLEYVQHHESFNARGEPLSTYNPKSKWDWYVIGGRWDGWIHGREASGEAAEDNMATTEQARERGIIPHAIVTPEGDWHERGQLGWWAILVTENEDWDAQAREILAAYTGHFLLILDAHI